MNLIDMEHKLTFTLGDPSWDGHGLTSVYYITCNHSSEEIESAYKEMCEKLGFDFLELFSDYECSLILSQEHTEILVENGIINPDKVITERTLEEYSWYGEEDLNAVEIEGEDDYLEIFFNIIKVKLPDLEWDRAKLDFDTLSVLDGAGYGLFHL